MFGPPSIPEKDTTDYAGELRLQLIEIHVIVTGRTNLVSDKIKARYDRLDNSPWFNEGHN